jgi:anti-sigma B factor antagonist
MSHTHWLDREDKGEITIVRFKLPRLSDDDDTRTVFNLLHRLVEVMSRKKLVVNLAQVDYVASLAVAKIVMLNRKVQSAGGKLVLCELTDRVRNILHVTHLDDLLSLHDSEDQALQAFTETANEPEA